MGEEVVGAGYLPVASRIAVPVSDKGEEVAVPRRLSLVTYPRAMAAKRSCPFPPPSTVPFPNNTVIPSSPAPPISFPDRQIRLSIAALRRTFQPKAVSVMDFCFAIL